MKISRSRSIEGEIAFSLQKKFTQYQALTVKKSKQAFHARRLKVHRIFNMRIWGLALQDLNIIKIPVVLELYIRMSAVNE